MTYTVQ